MSKLKNYPTEPGFYFAKSDKYEWWNLIAEIYGEFPLFKIRAWHRSKDTLGSVNSIDITEWGPKIEEPE